MMLCSPDCPVNGHGQFINPVNLVSEEDLARDRIMEQLDFDFNLSI